VTPFARLPLPAGGGCTSFGVQGRGPSRIDTKGHVARADPARVLEQAIAGAQLGCALQEGHRAPRKVFPSPSLASAIAERRRRG
jgi:hypothetical protein